MGDPGRLQQLEVVAARLAHHLDLDARVLLLERSDEVVRRDRVAACPVVVPQRQRHGSLLRTRGGKRRPGERDNRGERRAHDDEPPHCPSLVCHQPGLNAELQRIQRHSQPERPGLRLDEPRAEAVEPFEADRRPVHLLPRDRACLVDEVRSRRVDHPRVAQTELGVERSAHLDELAELVAADDAAEGVGRLHIQVERQRRRRPQLCELRHGDVRRDVRRRSAEAFELAQAEWVRRRHHHRDLPDDVDRQLALALHLGEQREQPQVGDQKPSDPALHRPRHVFDRVAQPTQPAQLPEVRRPVGRPCVRADVIALARPDEQRYLDPGRCSDLRHRPQLRLAQQHRAAALRDAVDDDVLGLGGRDDLLEHARPFDARDLDPEVGAVRERRGCRPAVLWRRLSASSAFITPPPRW